MATSNPGGALAQTTNVSVLQGIAITSAQFSAPTPEILSNTTSVYQTPDGQLWKSNSQSLVTFAGGGSIDTSGFATFNDLNTSVQIAVNTAQDRNFHYNNDPAANVLLTFPNGSTQTLQNYINNLEIRLTTLGSTAPINTVQPAAPTGTVQVGFTLTALNGTWTGASTYNYIWYRVNATTGAFTATGGTAATYVVQTADVGFKMAVSVAGVTAAGVIAAPVISAVSATVTATIPVISVAPVITPAGPQAVGVQLSCSAGTWTRGGFTFISDTYQWTYTPPAGVLANISGATDSTYTPVAGQEGGVIGCKVVDTTTQGSSLPATASNTVTISGAAGITLSAPAFPATVTQGVAGTITNSTPTGGSPTLALTRIYAGSMTAPYVQIASNPCVYTPESPSQLQQILIDNGFTTLVGVTLTCDQQWTLNGTTYTSPKSAGKVVQAPSATLSLTIKPGTVLNWTQNVAVSSTPYFTVGGGVAPFTYSQTPSMPSGTAISSSTGLPSGTPTVSVVQTTHALTVQDSTGATASASFAIVVNSASVSALPYILSPAYGIEAPNDADGSDYSEKTYGNGASIPPLSTLATVTRGGVTRFGPTSLGGLPCVQHRIISGDPLRNGGNRSEYSYDGFRFSNGEDVWFAAAYYFTSDMAYPAGGASEGMLIQQTHQDATSLTNLGNPFGLQWYGATSGSTRYTKGLNWIVVASGSGGNGADTPLYVWENPIGQWFRVITHYRSGFAAAGNAPIMEAWVATGTTSTYTKLTARTTFSPNGANTDFGDPLSVNGSGNDWAKIGFYKFGYNSYGASSSRTMYSSGLYAKKGANLFNDAVAALAPYAI